jgi:hypothetical protein
MIRKTIYIREVLFEKYDITIGFIIKNEAYKKRLKRLELKPFVFPKGLS